MRQTLGPAGAVAHFRFTGRVKFSIYGAARM